MTSTVKALIISAMKVDWSYHQLKEWGYNIHEINFIIWYGSERRHMTGNVRLLILILKNPGMLEV